MHQIYPEPHIIIEANCFIFPSIVLSFLFFIRMMRKNLIRFSAGLVLLLVISASTSYASVPDSLLALYRNAKNDSSGAKYLLQIAKHWQAENPDSAIHYYSSLLELAKKSSFPEMEAEGNKGLGVISYMRGESDAAIDYYYAAIECRKRLPKSRENEIGTANLWNNIALAYYRNGENIKALNIQGNAEKIRLEVNDKAGLVAFTYPNIGAIYIELGNYPKAQEYFYKSLKICEELGDKEGIADAYDNIGVVCEAGNDFEAALSNYQKSMKIRGEIGDEFLLSYSYNNVGVAYYKLKQYDLAIDYYLKSLEIKTKTGDDKGMGNTFNNLGLAYQDKGDLKISYDYFSKAIEKRVLSGDTFGLTGSLTGIGGVATMLGKTDEAISHLKKAYKLAVENQFTELRKDVCLNLSDACYKKGQYKEARDYLKEHKEISDSLFNAEMIRKITSIELQYSFNKQQVADSLRAAEDLLEAEIRMQEENKRNVLILWALGAVFVLLMLLSYALFSSYRMKQKTKEALLREEAGEMEKKLLRSQMNPHFLFNSLNSIQNFITKNDSHSAVRYLSRFASLIRSILDNSGTSTVCLADELTALQNYLELEQLRFDHRFNFSIRVDDNAEPEFISIPPMLLQPYIENAIMHGVMHLESGGNIDISITADEARKILTCIITDNGIGREKARQLRKPGHKSVGMQITRERLEYLNRDNKSGISVRIDDLYKTDGNPEGTRVTVIIPYFEI